MTTRSIMVTIVTAVSATLAVGLASESDTIDLKYKFRKGESITYKLVMNQTMDMVYDLMPGKSQNATMEMKAEMYHKTTELEPKAARIEVGFSRYDIETRQGKTRYPTPHLDDVKKLRLSLRMTELGEITESKLINPEQVNPQFKQMAESIRSSIAHNIVVLPDRPVHPGESWNIEQEIPANLPGAMDLKMKIKATYKLIKVVRAKEGAQAEIDVQMKMLLENKSDRQDPIPVKASLAGDGQGKCLFSIKKGRMLRNQASFKLNGTTITKDHWGEKLHIKVNMQVKFKMEAA